MLKVLICALILLSTVSLSAQLTTDKRSLTRKARVDVANFRLNKTDLKEFKKNKRNDSSDYFKPVKSMVSDTTLLTDSIYVKAFRVYAYVKTKSRVNTGMYALVGGGIIIGFYTLVVLSLQNNSF